MPLPANLVSETEAFVRSALAGNDASHDFQHIERVWRQTQKLAEMEGLSAEDTLTAEVAALLHDVDDWKYAKDGDQEAGSRAARGFLESKECPAHFCDRIAPLVQRVSFHDELGRSEDEKKEASQDRVLAVVQDADRLDAIGAIGIARCITYGGAKKRQLYDENTPRGCTYQEYQEKEGAEAMLTKEQYVAISKSKNGATIDHFYEKLLRISSMMKTDAGLQVARARHKYMEGFLQQLFNEIDGSK